jgi:hypothetical protein
MHAVSHIASGDAPEAHKGRTLHNYIIGSTLHHRASVFWAVFFEALFGRGAERSTAAALAGGAAISAAAYVTDYHLVSDRFKRASKPISRTAHCSPYMRGSLWALPQVRDYAGFTTIR